MLQKTSCFKAFCIGDSRDTKLTGSFIVFTYFVEVNKNSKKEGVFMRKKNYKGRCEKRNVPKCKGVCKTYDSLQSRMVDILSEDEDVKEIRCNVPMDGTEYTSDIVCTMENYTVVVYECCYRNLLKRPSHARLLQQSREYWLKHGVKEDDWRLVVDAKK